MRILLKVEYLGSAYSGWQIQPNKRTIQSELTEAIRSLTGEAVTVIGSGRTDAGVHALAQTAHFDLRREFDINKLVSGLNFYLPSDIRVHEAKQVANDFHAQRDVRRKTYVYKAYRSMVESAIDGDRKVRIRRDIDVQAMVDSCRLFVGEHDFASFCSSGSSAKTTVRTVYDLHIEQKGDEIEFYVTGNGFLYNMVRKIVATLIAVGEHKLDDDGVMRIFDAHSPSACGLAPAKGLYLFSVEY